MLHEIKEPHKHLLVKIENRDRRYKEDKTMAIYIAHNEDLVSEYDDTGFAKKEALPGTYEGGIRNYKCFLKAGCQVTPEMYEDKLVLFFLEKEKDISQTRKVRIPLKNCVFMCRNLIRHLTLSMQPGIWSL